ncbi:MAG: DNA (cytosine-5-)-methyltransferase [Kiritimatiellae bacterium]|nr:DNA (cytosine-5-)-methyltransferase [Kiritimatiellia bacterium]
MTHLELFSGIGGFRQAMRLLSNDGGPRFDCIGFSEIDTAATKTYLANFDTTNERVLGDISAFVENGDSVAHLPRFDLLTGGFPCQSFSMMGEQRGFEDARGTLFFCMAQLIKACKPDYLLLENVKNLRTHDSGKTYQVIEHTLSGMGYRVFSDIFNTSEFGLAQVRNRIYIFATTTKLPRNFLFSADAIKRNFEAIRKTSLVKQRRTSDALHKNAPSKYWLSDRIKRTILANGSGGFIAKSEIDLDIARPLCATMAKMHRACQDNYFSEAFIDTNGKQRYAGGVDGCENVRIRRLMPEEAFELQGFDSAFVKNARRQFGIADSSFYKQAGNAISVNVVYAILAYLSSTLNWR